MSINNDTIPSDSYETIAIISPTINPKMPQIMGFKTNIAANFVSCAAVGGVANVVSSLSIFFTSLGRIPQAGLSRMDAARVETFA
ncbi:MAG: hypothetical protein LBN23_00420 [Paludibacter sp.]|nr:hypothetical protein [Paludibacter sp.]